MQQMMAEHKAREMAMASHGGENPWEVAYNKDQAKNISESEKSSDMNDSAAASPGSTGEGGLLDKATKSFSF